MQVVCVCPRASARRDNARSSYSAYHLLLTVGQLAHP